MEIAASQQRFHAVQKELSEKGGKLLLNDGETLIRVGTSKMRLRAEDYYLLKQSYLESAQVTPSLSISFRNKASFFETPRSWPLVKRFAYAYFRPPDHPGDLRVWTACHVGVPLYVCNDGTTQADQFTAELLFPEHCRPLRTLAPRHGRSEWKNWVDPVNRKVKAIGRDLVHGDTQFLGHVLLQLEPPMTAYKIQWKIMTGNRTAPTTGTIEVRVRENTPP